MSGNKLEVAFTVTLAGVAEALRDSACALHAAAVSTALNRAAAQQLAELLSRSHWQPEANLPALSAASMMLCHQWQLANVSDFGSSESSRWRREAAFQLTLTDGMLCKNRGLRSKRGSYASTYYPGARPNVVTIWNFLNFFVELQLEVPRAGLQSDDPSNTWT